VSALDDLRNVATALDSALTGWISYPFRSTTKVGEQALQMVATLRQRRYKDWGENCALRARLGRALADNNGLRDCNRVLTDQVLRLEAQRPTVTRDVTSSPAGGR
jgi:hypothetical protein